MVAQIILNPFQSIYIRSLWLFTFLVTAILASSRFVLSAEDALPNCVPATRVHATVVQVIDSHSFETAKGRVIKLAAIVAPNTGAKLKGRKSMALVKRTRKLLTRLVLNKPVILMFGTDKLDRYGRRIAHVFVSSPKKNSTTWVQGEMVKQGLARVFPNTLKATCVNGLLEIEKTARLNKTGLWKNKFHQVIEAENLKYLNRALGRLQLIEGQVHTVAVRRNRSYINFSKDWKRDFTVTISSGIHKLFTQSGINIKELTGKHIRVRGWLDRHNGPTINVYHVAQIEVLKK